MNIPTSKYDEAFRRLNEFQDSFISWIEQFDKESDNISRIYFSMHSLENPIES